MPRIHAHAHILDCFMCVCACDDDDDDSGGADIRVYLGNDTLIAFVVFRRPPLLFRYVILGFASEE